MSREARRPATDRSPDFWRPLVAKALVGHFVAPDPIAAAQVQSLRRRVAELEARVLLLETELAARQAVDEPTIDAAEPALV